MSKTWDVMVDIESYSEQPCAAIASIGAVKFNILTRELGDTFYINIDPKSSKEYGLHFSKSTLAWWKTQSLEARQALVNNAVPLPVAMADFSDWLGTFGKIGCWNMFDIPILQWAYHQVGSKEPWKYYHTIECRTIADMLGKRIDRSVGTHHNALDDAINQAKFMIEILNPLD